MNADQQIVQSAYEDAIKQLYAKFFQAYAEAGGDSGQMQQADTRFLAGVRLARNSRDHAIALLATS